jgi:hypothetical protein
VTVKTLILVSAVAALATSASAAELTPDVIGPYLRIQTALAHDTLTVTADAGAIATAAVALGDKAAPIVVAATTLAHPADLAAARARFGVLSEAIEAYVTTMRLTLPNGVKAAFCPMAKKPWLQEGARIANPYYGSEMPLCGTFRP